ncbi:hypothetical protein DPO94_24925 [Salmonella enterica subsp. enterica serovar Emek]|uniref:hypothetical protein n=1 Tax=Salmonella enterica TaxID=28901 RepID=UPI00092B44AD|nr:hypothetical protein [Salmonella enterica]EBC1870862.1 hypothetical protein [Salmonella enterica subsp. enterica serovar Newport]EBG5999170.1 hypothetical protein [Salmonella enterica subsp. enterica serovar Emek]EBU9457104.1 hypothetical protein [Salmonella enterica subsp. enterica serovar Corvallis]ECB5701714.1 hypothetical protein [Salmonella enterica subsp. enterica serovar Molade]EIG0949518.1 hypothetical protein [Salmonella enterica subsp. enterica serovar Muenchen]HAU3469545.1 hypot
MSKVSRGMKISLIFILNPHRIFLALAVWLSYFVYWLADKLDDFAGWLENFANARFESWPLIGERMSDELNRYYADKRKEKSRRASEAIIPASQRSNQK